MNGKVVISNAQRRSAVKVLPSRPSDVYQILKDGLRASDLEELGGLGRDPKECLLSGLRGCGALVFTVFVDRHPVAMFGAAPIEPGVASVWLLGTEGLNRARRELLMDAPVWLDMLNMIYPTLTNFVSEDNVGTIFWLERMGFEFPFVDDFTTDESVTYRRFVRCVQ